MGKMKVINIRTPYFINIIPGTGCSRVNVQTKDMSMWFDMPWGSFFEPVEEGRLEKWLEEMSIEILPVEKKEKI